MKNLILLLLCLLSLSCGSSKKKLEITSSEVRNVQQVKTDNVKLVNHSLDSIIYSHIYADKSKLRIIYYKPSDSINTQEIDHIIEVENDIKSLTTAEVINLKESNISTSSKDSISDKSTISTIKKEKIKKSSSKAYLYIVGGVLILIFGLWTYKKYKIF